MQRQAQEYQYLSRPVEELIRGHQCESAKLPSSPTPDQIAGRNNIKHAQSETNITTCDVLIVGSGYGGAMAAHVLAGAKVGKTKRPIRVVVFERGKEFAPGEFPESLGDLPGEVRFHRNSDNDFIGDANALFDFRSNKDVSVLIANGLGGGSLINANVALKPDNAIFNDDKWPAKLQDAEALKEHFDAALRLLGVVSPQATWLPKKYSALARLANSIDATTRPAPLTVDLDLCTKCGNCITGCNVGAKKTLPFTILRDAQKKGAEIYTGANVLTLRRTVDNNAWIVRFRRTATAKTILNREIFQIRAKIVILAAGTLGSTEILLRSSKRKKFPCSDKLGEGFSTNGDMISFGYAGSKPVNGTGQSSDETHSDPGPTITGYSSLSFPNNGTAHPLVMQDAAVPLALNEIFGEIVTTGSLLARYVKGDRPAWFNGNEQNPDPITVQRGAIANSQILLTMGYDNAAGTMELVPREGVTDVMDQSRIVINWPGAGKASVFEYLHETFKKAHDNGGFDGGDYIPNPAWKAVPDGFEQAFTGGAPAGKLLTVHPLGGCTMSDSAENGVVNHLGQVFSSGAGANTYDDLYVMDGAIVPGALGVNPFLTISAVAHRNSQEIRKRIEAGEFEFDLEVYSNVKGNLKKVSYGAENDDLYSTKSLDKRPITMVVRERLARIPGPLPTLTDEKYSALIDSANQYVKSQSTTGENISIDAKQSENAGPFENNRYYRLILSIEATFDLNTYLTDPDRTPLKGTAQLFLDPSYSVPASKSDKARPEEDDSFNSHSLFVEPIVADQLVPIANGTCQVGLLVRDDPTPPTVLNKRWWDVLCAAAHRRGEDFSLTKVLKDFKNFKELFLTVTQHAHRRKFEYVLTFDEGTLTKALGSFELSGQKLLAYTGENPWKALFKMGITLNAGNISEGLGDFHVDLNYLLKDGIPQVKESPHMPATLVGMARLGLFALRALFQTHLWSFGAPNYKEHEPLSPVLPEIITLTSGKRCTFTQHHLNHRDLGDLPGKPFDVTPYIRLARYSLDEVGKSAPKKHLLLIHGLAHAGAVFTTSTIKTPMAAYFVEQGYVVWVLDHRLSPALEWQPHRRPVTMDDLAKTDIRIAVEHVYTAADCQQIDVFAHCIGAGAFAMAALKGCLHDHHRKRSKIARATIHAVTPWLVPSAKNAASAKLAAFYKDSLRFDDPVNAGFDPIPPGKTESQKQDFFEVLIDRIAGSIPWPAGNSLRHQRAHTDKHMSKAICDRMTLWYGYEWNHSNLSDKTHQQIGSLVGFGNLEVFRHLYFCILRERLTDREGQNTYLTEGNIQKHWVFDTMFIHGLDNQVFAPAGSRISAWKLNKTAEEIAKYDPTYKKPNVWRCDVYGYGHMDLLFGEKAFDHVYPQINGFFQDSLDATTSDESLTLSQLVGAITICKEDSRGLIKYRPSGKPVTGPIIFNPEFFPNSGEYELRVWLEPTSYSTSPAHRAEFNVANQSGSLSTIEHIYHLEIPSKYGTFWVETLSIPANLGRIQIRSKVFRSGPTIPEGEAKKASIGLAIGHKSKMVPMRKTIDSEIPAIFADNEAANLDVLKSTWTAKLDQQRRVAFALGSCRYPGSPFEKDSADRLFEGILKQAKPEQEALDFVMFVGDQIYADATANVFDTTEVVERYWQRYRDALGSPNMNALLNYLPVYFAVDDHEFDDNWLGSETKDPKDPRVDRANARRYEYALDAARSYQGMARYTPKQHNFWYDFRVLDYPFFVMDTRTGRNIRWAYTTSNEARIVVDEQWSELEDWLKSLKDYRGPKFIACGAPLAPPLDETIQHNETWRNDDTWLGFPGSLASLVELLADNDIKNVVLLGGDLHLSAYASMTFKAKGKEVQVHQIIASGLYVPLPFTNTKPRDLGYGLYAIPGSACEIEFCEPTILTTSPSHFVRVAITPTDSRYQILIQAYDDKKKLGKQISLTTS